MKPGIAFRLGRVSNLPTVWTNALAGAVLSGAPVIDGRLLPVLVGVSLAYVGGMFLNDAFDAEIDAAERPERPIPSGEVSRRAVYAWGYAMLAASVLMLVAAGGLWPGGSAAWVGVAGVALAGAIVLYNWHHKQNPLSPVIMAACRALVYFCSALAFVAPPAPAVWIGAALLTAYLIGLTYVAKQENLGRVKNMWPLLFLAAPVVYLGPGSSGDIAVMGCWALLTVWMAVALYFVVRRGPGDIPRAVVSLIAGISLLDAALIASAGAGGLALAGLLGFGLTLALQKYIAGT